jgi:hypothetical protein
MIFEPITIKNLTFENRLIQFLDRWPHGRPGTARWPPSAYVRVAQA